METLRKIVLVAHNLRSCHNVGSLLRTAEGLGVDKVILTGYTPYPAKQHDTRLPHLAKKLDSQIHKTALGAENSVAWEQADDVLAVIGQLRRDGYGVYALEQAPGATMLPELRQPGNIAVVLGREVKGVEPEVLAACGGALEIPMLGKKESFNVVQAAAMALYHIKYMST